MKHRKLFARGCMVALLAIVFTRPAARIVFMDGLIGVAEMTQRICDDPCSIFNRHRFFLWQRFDPTCPEYL
jgi:hypothetical protein